MRRANPGFSTGPAAVLVATLVLAAVAMAVWGLSWWSFGVVLGGQIITLAWLVVDMKATDRDAKNVPLPSPDQRQKRRRLVAQLHDVRDAAGALPDAVVLLDARGNVRWFNAAATRCQADRRWIRNARCSRLHPSPSS